MDIGKISAKELCARYPTTNHRRRWRPMKRGNRVMLEHFDFNQDIDWTKRAPGHYLQPNRPGALSSSVLCWEVWKLGMLRKNCGKEISILIGWTRSCVLFVQAAAAWTCTNKMFWSSLIFARRLWTLLLRPLFLLSERCDDWSLCCWPQFWMAFRNLKTPFKSFQILLKDIYVKNWQYLKIVLLWFWRDLLNFNQKDILLFKSQFRQKAECTILTRKQWVWPGIALSSSVEPSETEGRRGEWAPIFLLVGKLVEISDINLRYWLNIIEISEQCFCPSYQLVSALISQEGNNLTNHSKEFHPHLWLVRFCSPLLDCMHTIGFCC